jgi:hypothetical protein
MGVDDILDGARADLKAEEQLWNERVEREKGRRKRAEAALEERPTAAELEEANERASRLEREVARLRGARDGSPSPSDARRLERENAELRRENDGLRADVAARDSEVARRKDQKRELQAAYRDKVNEADALGAALARVTPALHAALANQPSSRVDAARLAADVADHLNAARGAKTPRGLQPKTPRVVSADVEATTKKRRRADDTSSRRRRDDDASARRRRDDSSRSRRRDGESSRSRRRRDDGDREPRAALWPENGAAAERRSRREDKPASARRPERHSIGAPALDRAALQRGRAPAARRSDEGTKRRRRDDAAAPAPAPAPSMSISESWDPSQEEEEAPAAPPPTPAEAPAPAPAPSMREPGGFAYQSVVRKKCERAKMPGHFCDQCQGFIDATKDQLSDADVKKLQDECSRHKAYHPPPGTPEGFWELSFMDSQEKRKQDSLDAF